MLTIGICDDSKQDENLIRDMLSKALFAKEDYQVDIFGSGQEIIDAIEKNKFTCNFLLLVIYMEPVGGMAVAGFIRKNKVDVDIIFITKSVEHVYEGYVYKAFAYILKEKLHTDMEKELLRYMDEINMSEECLNVVSDWQKKRIPISAIQYVESDARKLILHTKTEKVDFYAKMSNMEAVLNTRGFVRIHQSYMVRISSITGMNKESVSLGDSTMPISRKYYANVKQIFEEQIGGV